MDRKEKVLSYINSKEYTPLKIDELMIVLDVPRADRELLLNILEELTAEGKVFISKRGRYAPVNGSVDCAAGILTCSARGYFGFVVCDEESCEDIFVTGENMADALSGDRVLVHIDSRKNSTEHREGRVVKVLERVNKTVIGVIYKEKNGLLCVRPDNRRIYARINIRPENAQEAVIGDRVVVSEVEHAKDGRLFGIITEVLGDENSLKGCIEGILRSYNIKQEFDTETLREADKIPQSVGMSQLEGREDLRDMLIFTIDGDDARDFDDAVSLEQCDNGNYLLGVHIADVSEYVKDGTALDSEAYERGTSVYLADRVIPMLPEGLSNGICSLNPRVDRLTLSVFMEIDKNGDIAGHRLVKTVIRSKERMTYNNVNKILEESDIELCKRYEYMLPTLKCMEQLAEILRNKRIKRGAIQFDFPESHIIVDEEGKPASIEKEIRGTSNKMIEEFMLAANETVAEYAFWSEIPFIYRNHEAPSSEKIKAFNQLIMRFGLSIKGKIDEDNPIHPKALQKVIDEVTGTPAERIVSANMLQSLMKAKYSDTNAGHFGLAAKYYCHFTSPIRRYPDLVVHRILKKLLDGRLTDVSTAMAANHSSECEVTAEHVERDTDDLMKAAYMSQFVGETFEGIIANVTSFGMFVELDNTVEGLIRLENMTDDFYEFDEVSGTVTGKRNGRAYTTGDVVSVVLARADILSRQIDFVLEGNASEGLLKRIGNPKFPKRANIKKHTVKKYKRKKK